MSIPKSPEPVTLIIGMLSGKVKLFDQVESELKRVYGLTDLYSPILDFNYTDYYGPEMGPGLKRKFFSFQKKIDPGKLASIKIQTNELEKIFSKKEIFVPRPINLDPGYISRSKLVLASTKNYSHRIYLSDGIYAEITLVFRKKRFIPLEMTFPDYRSEAYVDFFTRVREQHLCGKR